MCVSEEGHACIQSVSEKQDSCGNKSESSCFEGTARRVYEKAVRVSEKGLAGSKIPTLATTVATTRGHPNGH